MTTEKIKTLEQLKEITTELKQQNKKIVWTNGCFDLLHIGHIRYLQDAKAFGDILIIGDTVLEFSLGQIETAVILSLVRPMQFLALSGLLQ